VARRAPTLRVEAVLAGLDPAASPEDAATEAMLEATSALLSAYGIRRWSMDDVAERAGLGRATVYRRFDSRDDLVHATLAHAIRGFFAAVAEAVAGAENIEDKVVEGFLVGLKLVRDSWLPGLVASDPATAVTLATAAPVIALARTALVERFQAISHQTLSPAEAAEAGLVAEVLVRLGTSFVLVPESAIDLDDPVRARAALRRVIGPLLVGAG
jgi:AcrR family transcriptional regulator